VLDLALARVCGGCGTAGTRWCAGCAEELTGPLLRRGLGPTGAMGSTSSAGPPHSTGSAGGDADVPLEVWSAAPYEGAVRTALVAWKDHDRPDLTAVLAVAVHRAARAALARLPAPDGSVDPPLIVVPAPSSRSARRSRGWQPVPGLARRTAGGLARRGTPAGARMLPVLVQRAGVRDQSSLDADERDANLNGALWVPPSWRAHLRGRPCLLLDDVVTTGATLREGARALREAGAGPVVAATVATTVLRRSR
jgi:predicted amidophosphoribosyltransferase